MKPRGGDVAPGHETAQGVARRHTGHQPGLVGSPFGRPIQKAPASPKTGRGKVGNGPLMARRRSQVPREDAAASL